MWTFLYISATKNLLRNAGNRKTHQRRSLWKN
nr:MAG TPA: hypothetical protein [Caudoviricetes sp.]